MAPVTVPSASTVGGSLLTKSSADELDRRATCPLYLSHGDGVA